MDKLVFNKFALKKKEIFKDLEKQLPEIKKDFSVVHLVHPSIFIEKAYTIIIEAEEKVINALLESYKEVQLETGEEIILNKENEIRDEVNKLPARECDRVCVELDKLPLSMDLKPSILPRLLTDLREYATTKTDILIEIEKRRSKHKKEDRYNILSEKLVYKEKLKDDGHFKCFVIMPIGKKGTIEYENNMLVYNKIIKPCAENSGYDIECYHADLITESGDISKQVMEALRDDPIVIADLRRNNTNVIYELGIRHAFGKRSILVCSNQSEHLFHTTTYRAIEYKIDGTSNKDFYDRLASYIDDIIKNPEKPDNPVADSLGIVSNPEKSNAINKKIFHVSRVVKSIYSLAEVYNQSDMDISDLDINLGYTDGGGNERKVKAKLLNTSDDPRIASPYICSLMKKGDVKLIANFPRTKAKVLFKGKESDSGKEFEEIFEIPELS